MTKSEGAKYFRELSSLVLEHAIALVKLAGPLALLAFCTSATAWRESSGLESTRVALESVREATELDLNKIENVRCQGVDRPSSTANKRENAWRGLVPLHSTREEVERLLGPPKRFCWQNIHL